MGRLRRRGWVGAFVKTASISAAGFLTAVSLGGVAAGAGLTSSDGTGADTTTEDAETTLTFDKSGPETAAVGQRIVYELDVENTGGVDAQDVDITDVLPPEATEVQFDEICELSENTVVCELGVIPVEEQARVTLSFVVAEPAEITNTAAAGATNVSSRPEDSVTTTVAPTEDTGEEVLIFGPTDTNTLREAVESAGFVPVVVSAQGWGELTTADFREYRALLIGDPFCSGSPDTVAAAVANASVWGAAVDGNVIIDGTDPVFHGRDLFTDAAVAFAVSSADRTGAYVSLSCYYHGTPALTPVPLLDAFEPGGFTTTGVGCFNDAHIVADHPALSGISDADLSDWGCSVHEAFDSWPDDFVVLAIARNAGSAYTATDGTVGTPYILARGEDLRVISDITLATEPTDSALGSTRTVSATVVEDEAPQVGKSVTFRVISGPHEGTEGASTTDAAGTAVFSYTGSQVGEDAIEASYVDSSDATQTSNRIFVNWIPAPTPPPTTTEEPEKDTTPTETQAGSPVPTATEQPPPPQPAPPPEEPGTFNAQATAGTVLINGRLAAGTIELQSGDVVDATNGRVEIVTDGGRAEFYEGAFKITQASKAGAVTRLELVGGDFSACGARKPARRQSDHKPVRKLWGKGKGKFETKARYSSATVRGTAWLTEDRCNGSLTLAEEGTVVVYDLSLRRRRVLTGGSEYLAEPPPPPAPGRFVGEPKGKVIVNGTPTDQATQIRSGDTIDVRNGSIELTTTTGEATFYSGRFVVSQTGGSSAFTVLTLVGGDYSTCGARARSLSSRADDPPKKTVRSLWGKGKGKFKTKSRYSSATVRGTLWLTVDRCDGSLTVVHEGIVEVFDLTLRRTVQVGPGERYLAPAQAG